MEKIFIHIGTHKTGTSAIQDFLVLNRKTLSKQGILYPQKKRRDYFETRNGETIVPVEKFRHYEKLVRRVRKKDKHVILSNEAFCLMADPAPVKAALGSGVETVIICYLRRQDNFVQSYYNQEVKHAGNYKEIMVYQPPATLDYYELLGRWARVFGKESIVVRPYEKQQFKNQDLIVDFLSLVGIEWSDDFKRLKKNANPRLPAEIIEYMRLLNSLVRDKKKRKKIKNRLLDYSSVKFKDDTEGLFYNHSLFNPNQKYALFQRYDASNQRVAREYLGRENGCLFQEPLPDIRVPAAPEIRLTDKLINDITHNLYRGRQIRKILIRALEQDPAGMDDFTRFAYQKISRVLNF
jgi:hypothetical protein